jgi:ribonuclease G
VKGFLAGPLLPNEVFEEIEEMYKEILISLDEREGRAVVLEDGQVMEILIAREERQVGSIYKGRVSNVLPGMNAAFVDIGLERNGFLCADDAAAHLGDDVNESLRQMSISDILKVNQETLVQVVKEAVGTKGARITTYVTLPGRYLVLLPSAQYIGVSRRILDEEERNRLRVCAEKIRPEGMGVIVRTAAAGRIEEDLQRDLDYLVKVWDKVQQSARKRRAPALVHQELALVDKVLRDLFTPDIDRLIIDNPVEHAKMRDKLESTAPVLLGRMHLYTDRRPLFELHNVESEMEKALNRKVWLDSGGYLIIDRTEALWVIDVNTGKFIGKTSLADTILRTNLEACREICRQLRLRDMAGIIVIDFIDMDSADDQRKVLEFLEDELRRDRTRTHLVGMTELGLVQLTRKREGKDLDAVMREPCPVCSGRGRLLSAQTLAFRVRREILRLAMDDHNEAILVRVHPHTAIELIGVEGEEAEALERDSGRTILIQVDQHLHPECHEVLGGPKNQLGARVTRLSQGHQVKVRLEEPFGPNIQSALAVVNGHLVEVLSGGDRLGKEVQIRLIRSTGAFCQAEIVR